MRDAVTRYVLYDCGGGFIEVVLEYVDSKQRRFGLVPDVEVITPVVDAI